MESEVTVVIPVYNREAYIADALDSILFQTMQAWKVLIVDDASTDKTAEKIAPYLADERIQYRKNRENRGVGKTLDKALALVDTPYFVIVDSDDWLEKDALETLLAEMKRQPPSTSLVCGNAQVWQEKEGVLERKGLMRHRSFADKYDFLLYGPMLTPRFFRTEAVRRVKGFLADDLSGGRYNEDRYLLLRLIANSRFHHVDKLLYNIRLHGDNLTKKANQGKFNETKKDFIESLMRKWGDEYRPVFYKTPDGWLDVERLVPTELVGAGR